MAGQSDPAARFIMNCHDPGDLGEAIRLRAEPLGALTHATNAANATESIISGRLYACQTLVERLSQDLEDVTLALREFIQQGHPMVGQRHLARHGPLAAAAHANIRS
jgi:hypothetical protein